MRTDDGALGRIGGGWDLGIERGCLSAAWESVESKATAQQRAERLYPERDLAGELARRARSVYTRGQETSLIGIIAIFYNLTNSSMDNIRGKHDVLNSLTAAAASGAIYKSTGERFVLIRAVDLGARFPGER